MIGETQIGATVLSRASNFTHAICSARMNIAYCILRASNRDTVARPLKPLLATHETPGPVCTGSSLYKVTRNCSVCARFHFSVHANDATILPQLQILSITPKKVAFFLVRLLTLWVVNWASNTHRTVLRAPECVRVGFRNRGHKFHVNKPWEWCKRWPNVFSCGC